MIDFPVPTVALAVATAFVLFLGSADPSTPNKEDIKPGRILVLPFQLKNGSDEKALDEFRDHANQKMRAALKLVGDKATLESDEVVRRVVDAHGGDLNSLSDEQFLKLGLDAGSDALIHGFISVEQSYYRMRAVMWDLRKGKIMVSTDLKVPSIYGLPALLQVFLNNVNRRIQGSPGLPFYQAGPSGGAEAGAASKAGKPINIRPSEGPWRSPEVDAHLRAIDIGDLDGDGKNEAVFLDRSGVTISRYESGTLRTLTQFSRPPSAFIAAEVEDLDGDGISELILCAQTPTGIESSVVGYVGGDLRVICTLPDMFLATIPDPADEKRRVLVGQRTDVEDIFTGAATRFIIEGNTAVSQGPVALPPGTLILSYASGRLGRTGVPVKAILSQDQRLMVFDRDNKLLANLTDRIFGLDRRISLPYRGKLREIALPGRIVIADTNRDGENELLLIKQTGRGSVVQDLVWDGTELRIDWTTIASPGIITDFRIRDFKNEGTPSLVLLLVRSSPLLNILGTARSVIYAYDIAP
ncbi:MAG: VCBS repeat-containing protein [Pseudomonadota bacterium]